MTNFHKITITKIRSIIKQIEEEKEDSTSKKSNQQRESLGTSMLARSMWFDLGFPAMP